MGAKVENLPFKEAANMAANTTKETGGDLRVRLGIQPRTFQKVWKRTFGYSFDSSRIVTDAELSAIEAKYLNLGKPESKPQSKPKIKPAIIEKPKAKPQYLVSVIGYIWAAFKSISTELLAAWAMFLIPTIASIRNTVSVSGAFSGSHETALLITATISGTGILWIMSRKKIGWGDMAGIFFFQLFEAFSNTVQVFKTLMGTMSYGLTTVSGSPSEMLDMVAVTTRSDHRDTAILLACMVAFFILAAQVKGLLLIKSMKK